MPFQRARATIVRLSEHVHTLEARLPKPFWIVDRNNVQGARYSKPSINHYFVLSAAKMVSSLNAILLLIENGYLFEHGLLMRPLLEMDSKLGYVMAGVSQHGIDEVSAKFVQEYFADDQRSPDDRARYSPIKQADIHKRVSQSATRAIRELNDLGIPSGVDNANDELAKLHSFLYNLYSNYVHGRYPETMDLFDQYDRSPRLSGGHIERDIEVEDEMLHTMADTISKTIRASYLKLIVYDPLLLDDAVMAYAFGDMDAKLGIAVSQAIRNKRKS